jgi:hypothetical protein
MDAFNTLTDDILKSLIPKMGIYAKFKMQYEKYKNHAHHENDLPVKHTFSFLSYLRSHQKEMRILVFKLINCHYWETQNKENFYCKTETHLSNRDRQIIC